MRMTRRMSENPHLPFDRLTALSKVEGLCYPHPSSLHRTLEYASFLGMFVPPKGGMRIFQQPPPKPVLQQTPRRQLENMHMDLTR